MSVCRDVPPYVCLSLFTVSLSLPIQAYLPQARDLDLTIYLSTYIYISLQEALAGIVSCQCSPISQLVVSHGSCMATLAKVPYLPSARALQDIECIIGAGMFFL